MRVLALQAQEHDIGIVMVRHAGKDGKARGSSAFEGEADIVVGISRPEGNQQATIRKLEGIGRYGEWERIIELTEKGYISHGDDQKVQFNRAVKLIMSVLTPTPETRKRDILSANTEGISPSTIDRALDWLTSNEQGTVVAKQQMHLQGKPWVYWKAEPT
jgi:predicted ATP-dependent serine protease